MAPNVNYAQVRNAGLVSPKTATELVCAMILTLLLFGICYLAPT